MILTESELEQLRADQVDLLPDTCRVTRAGARGALDTSTGGYTPAGPSTVYEGACRVSSRQLHNRNEELGEKLVDLSYYTATLPFDVPGLLKNDVLTVLTSADEQLVGRRLEVQSVAVNSLQTARVVVLEEVS